MPAAPFNQYPRQGVPSPRLHPMILPSGYVQFRSGWGNESCSVKDDHLRSLWPERNRFPELLVGREVGARLASKCRLRLPSASGFRKIDHAQVGLMTSPHFSRPAVRNDSILKAARLGRSLDEARSRRDIDRMKKPASQEETRHRAGSTNETVGCIMPSQGDGARIDVEAENRRWPY